MARVLVTGGLGFIGSHLCPELYKAGHEVHIFDNCSNNKVDRIDGCKLVGSYENTKYDTVYHLAGTGSINPEMNPELIYNNIIFARDILSLPFRIVYASSASVYGVDNQYKLSKQYNEHLGNLHPNACGLRFFNVYGANDNGVVGKMLRACQSGEKFTIYGGQQTRDFIYVADVVNTIMKLGDATGIRDIGTGKPTSIEKLKQIIEHELGKVLDVNYETSLPYETKHSQCANPIKHFTTLEVGIDKLATWKE